jgi:alpha-methylacyl-CoA racemase
VTGPLQSLKGVELAGIGPAPFAAMVLADLGADIVRVDRLSKERTAYTVPPQMEVLNRGRRSVAVDLKDPAGRGVVVRLADKADFLIEGFRPGVAERLGLGPDRLQASNPMLVYGRMTGWGQDGPLAQTAGHDLNYLALTGILAALGRRDTPPAPPLNVVGDFGGGGLLLALGIVSALLERSVSGRGQVVDTAIVDGVSLLGSFLHGVRAAGQWTDERESNLIDGGAHMYDCYETADGRHMAVGAIEEKFYRALCDGLGLQPGEAPAPDDRSSWAAMHDRLASIFKTRTQSEWCEVFADLDACVTPVLTMPEAQAHPHLRGRGVFVDVDGVVQPAPAPRFSRTPGAVERGPAAPGQHTDEILAEAGVSPAEITALKDGGTVG